MTHDKNQDKDREDELLQEKLIKAYGSYSDVGMAKYHILETAKVVLPGKSYAVIDNYLSSCKCLRFCSKTGFSV